MEKVKMSSIISSILQLAEDIEIKQGSSPFNKLAYEALNEFKIDFPLDLFEQEVATWLLTHNVPKQLNLYNGFGHPPLTIFNNQYFVIDLYFWTTSDTSIHSHSFSGAFKVLYGKSEHQVFNVDIQKSIADDTLLTSLTIKSEKTLITKDTIEIRSGLDFSHRLIHLDNPTITICIRTINDKKQSQWHHFENGLSIKKQDNLEPLIKKISYYNYLYLRQPTNASSFLWQQFKDNSISDLINFYELLTSSDLGLNEDALEYFFESFHEYFKDKEWFKKYLK